MELKSARELRHWQAAQLRPNLRSQPVKYLVLNFADGVTGGAGLCADLCALYEMLHGHHGPSCKASALQVRRHS